MEFTAHRLPRIVMLAVDIRMDVDMEAALPLQMIATLHKITRAIGQTLADFLENEKTMKESNFMAIRAEASHS